jgi:tetratricopeptide (TPR) repeat protein
VISRTEEAVIALTDAVRLSEAVGDLNGLAWTLSHMAAVHAFRGELEQQRRHIERALEIAEHLGDPVTLADMVANLGDVAFYAGDWRRARREYERAATALDRAETTIHSPYPVCGLGRLALAEGRYEDASRYLHETVALADSSGNVGVLRVAQAELAEWDVLEGRAEVAVQRLAPLLDRAGQREIQVTALFPLLAWARSHTDEPKESVSELLTESTARAIAGHLRPALALARQAQGLVLASNKCWDEAEQALEESLRLSS